MNKQLPCNRMQGIAAEPKRNWNKLLSLILILQLFSVAAWAQSGSISGKVTDPKGEALIGVPVVIKDSSKGVSTAVDGSYKIENVTDGTHTLVISYVGYLNKEVEVTVSNGSNTNVNVSLSEDNHAIEEVIVTGVADARTRMESSVAISTVSSKQLDMQAAVSAADVLKNVPGVYVNSALGEIRNVVYSRGVSAGSVEAATGYYYVSLQEDGLPVTNVTWSNFGPDYFYRTDGTLKRLEAVRGGTASIFGANAPGGIFNYVSKTGQEAFGGELRAKLGMEGEFGNPYYRTDLNFGGAIAKDLYYNIGGFYRYSYGPRNAGYPMNHGGQIKANVVKKFDRGSVSFFAKYLNDNNGFFEFLPVKNFEDPKPAPGVERTTSYLPPKGKTTVPYGGPNNFEEYDPANLLNSKDYAAGMALDYDLGHGFTLRNSAKYTMKDLVWNSTAQAYPIELTNPNAHNLFGTAGMYGTYTLKRHGSDELLAVLKNEPASVSATGVPTGNKYTILQSTLPGQEVVKNGVVTQLALIQLAEANEIMDQLMLSKNVGNMTFTAGGFFANSKIKLRNGRAGVGLSTIEHQPDLIDVT